MLTHEEPLRGYSRRIGGSAGEGTHGGTDIKRPSGMPTRDECDHVVESVDGFVGAVREDNASVYLAETVDLSDEIDENGSISIGSNLTLVGGYCDPNIPGRGPELICEMNGHRVLTSAYGEAPTLWGVSFRGPRMEYHDPDHNDDDFGSKQSTALFCYDDDGTLTVRGCEFRGWTMAGLEIGAKDHITNATIQRSSFHHNQMEHLGYGIEHYNGFLSVTESFFDRCRHAISSFGYPSGGYAVSESMFGPGPWAGHILDMHSLDNNLDNGDRTAGKFVRIYHSTIMGTEDVRGYGQEGLAIRGIPQNAEPGSYVDKCHFYHDEEPEPTGDQGSAYRQETDEWRNFEPRDNHFGDSIRDGYGAPRARKAAEDDEEQEAENPSGTPTTPNKNMKTLRVDGQGDMGGYQIWINGDVSPTGDIEGNDQIEDVGDGQTKITGAIIDANDTYQLDDGATLDRAWFTSQVAVTMDGNPVDTGPLVSAEAQRRLDDKQRQLDQLRDWIRGIADGLRSIPRRQG